MNAEQLPELEASSPFLSFLKQDIVAATLLLSSALAAVIVANSPVAAWYHHLWETEAGFSIGGFTISHTLHVWVNDGLMAIFFFMAGLEIKRELLVGELATPRKAFLPAMAALGGMIFPALIYWGLNTGSPAASGWGIPMATDIAFAMGCLALLAGRVPPAAAVFLVALAIVDDIGAVIVIALFYTDQIAIQPLLIGAGLITLSALLALCGVRKTWPYTLIFIAVWFAFLKSGVHATVAGVLLAFTIPASALYATPLFEGRMAELLKRFTGAEDHANSHLVNGRQQELLRAMFLECRHVEAPLQRIESALHPLCLLVIMPIFAFANSGLHLDIHAIGGLLLQPVTLGVFLGLVLGKQLGVFTFSWLSVRLGLAELPNGVTWRHVHGIGLLAGIGFTMALFVNELAFAGHADGTAHLDEARIGIFLASLTAGTCGVLYLRSIRPAKAI